MEEMLEKYGVEESKRGGFNARGGEPQWIIKKENDRHVKGGVLREKKQIGLGRLASLLRGFRHRKKSLRKRSDDEEEALRKIIFEGLQGQSRSNITNQLRRFIEADNHNAVRISHMEKNSEAMKVVKPSFDKEIYQNATAREGVEELTVREGVADT